MVEVLLPCIYCRERPAKPGEHLIPRALGRLPVDGAGRAIVCQDDEPGALSCNHLLGQHVDVLFRRGVYSGHRRELPYGVGRSANGKGRSRAPSYQLPRVRVPGTELDALVELDQGATSGSFADQIFFTLPDSTTRVWRIPEGARTPDALREALREAGLSAAIPTRFIGDVGGKIERLVASVWPSAKLTNLPSIEPGNIVFSIESKIDPGFARAIAMIGFHFFLAFAGSRGGESAFAAIRACVRGNGNVRDFVRMAERDGERGALYPLRDHRPAVPKHVFVAKVGPSNELVVQFCLFAHSPKTPWWQVKLASQVDPSLRAMGVALVYRDKLADRSRYDLDIVPLRHEQGALEIAAITPS